MTAPTRPLSVAAIDINHLSRGTTYVARAATGVVATGEYLGIEVAYGEWRILLRGVTGIQSIAIDLLDSIDAAPPAAAAAIEA